MCLLKGMIETNKPSKLRLGKKPRQKTNMDILQLHCYPFSEVGQISISFQYWHVGMFALLRAVRGSTFETCSLVNHA